MSGAHRNGRAQRVRAYLATINTPLSARDICAAVEPGCDSGRMGATLACLAEGGYIERIGQGQAGVTWRFLTMSTKPADAPRRRHRSAVDNAERAGTATSAGTTPIRKAKPAAPLGRYAREQPANFSAPLDTVSDRWSPKHMAADAIAADVSAFVRNGGFVQHLVHGEGSQPLRTMPFQQDGPDAVATPARQRNRCA